MKIEVVYKLVKFYFIKFLISVLNFRLFIFGVMLFLNVWLWILVILFVVKIRIFLLLSLNGVLMVVKLYVFLLMSVIFLSDDRLIVKVLVEFVILELIKI